MGVLNKMKTCGRLIFDSKYRFLFMAELGRYDNLSDEEYLKRRFKAKMGKKLNLENPQTFNEKLQWLKLYDHNSIYTTLVDKIAVKSYVANLIGEEHIIPTLGEWNNAEEIVFEQLPNQFVLKCNHNSGKGMCICKDKQELDIEKTILELIEGLNENYYLHGREWPYKNVNPKIIAETYIADDLVDYKFFCFNGIADSVMVCIERGTGIPKFYFFDKAWSLKRYNVRGKEAPLDFTLPKPDAIKSMFEIAEKLSEGIPYVRVDLYYISGKIYFGEMTFFPSGGFDNNLLEETDRYWGAKLKLPEQRLSK